MFIYTMQDIVGVILLIILVMAFIIAFLTDYIKYKINVHKEKKNKR